MNNDENLKLREMFQRVNHSQFGDIDIPGFPFKLSDTEGSLRMPAPGLGEHTRLILGEWLGYSPEQIQELYEKKIVV